MAVEVTVVKPGSTAVQEIQHEQGYCYLVLNGDLHVFAGPQQRADQQLAVYSAGKWVSALVTHE